MRALWTVVIVFVTIIAAGGAHAGKGGLKLSINKEDVDLANRTLYFRLNRKADSAEIKVYSTDGKLLAERTKLYNGARPQTRLSIDWPKLLGQDAENFRIELKVTDVDEYWIGWEVVRFYLEIPHEEVVFDSGKWELKPSEAYKLDDALRILIPAIEKHGKHMDCRLYVAGHTDTVGSIADNRKLSNDRAKAIARYFASHGVKGIPIYTRGFGEELLAVETGDNVDNATNRRALYILSTFPPEMSGPGSWTCAHSCNR
jgi:outer membrane protein OmpA-like peptidoglycan-associated protein